MSYRTDGLTGCDPDQSFAWGPDLSGGYGGAGGIGGLVAYTDDDLDVLDPAPSDPDFLGPMVPIYDGNGNVVKMIRFEDLGSSFEARDRYDWHNGLDVNDFGATITNKCMGELHRQGLAKELHMKGEVVKKYYWKKGESPSTTPPPPPSSPSPPGRGGRGRTPSPRRSVYFSRSGKQ